LSYLENSENPTNTFFITKDGYKTIESNDSRKDSFIMHAIIDIAKRNQQDAKLIIEQIIQNNNGYLFKNITNQKCDFELLPYPSKNFGAFAYFGMTIGAYKYIDSLMYHIKDQDTRAIMYRSYNSNNSNNSNNSIPFSFYLNRMTQYLLLIPGIIVAPIFYIVSFIGLKNWENK
jgi:lipopolysaccharide export LptBFGC system permease protein LptF